MARGAARGMFYITLLGVTFPIGLILRASHARIAFKFILGVVAPFNLCCHLLLLPQVRGAESGVGVWHSLLLIWITLPLLVLGSVILQSVRVPGPYVAFAATLFGVLLFHHQGVAALQPTFQGTCLLQALFFIFQDGPSFAWAWCLKHVLIMQDHYRLHPSGDSTVLDAPKAEGGQGLVVGNAPNVLQGQPLGAVIDSFAEVVRFNSYKIHKPTFTGTKVTHHFCNGRQIPERSGVVMPLFNASLTHAVYLFFPHLEEAPEICARLKTSKASICVPNEERILKLCAKLGLRFWQVPSSGMVAIDLFMSRYEQVYIHGFSFFQGKLHYFQEPLLQLLTSWLERCLTHGPAFEKQWAEGLMADGKVIKLPESDLAIAAAREDEVTMKGKLDELEAEAAEGPGVIEAILKDGFPSQFSL